MEINKNKYRIVFFAVFIFSFFVFQIPISFSATLSKPTNNFGLVGYWSFNEGGGTIAHDFSGNKNNGSLTGTPTWVNGKFGSALNFGGSADYVPLNNPSNFQLTSGTVSAWIKTSNAGASFRGIVIKQSAYGLFLQDNVLITYDWNTSSSRTTSINLADNSWHHVVLTFNSGVANGTFVYIDGVLKLTTSMTILDQTNGLDIGCGGLTGNGPGNTCDIQFFAGSIDETRVYNRMLSATEVASLYNAGLVKINSSQNNQLTNGLVGLWSFNGADMSSTLAYDRSGNGNNGTFTVNVAKVPGIIGQALSFNGTDTHLDTNTQINTIAPTNGTACIWAYNKRAYSSGFDEALFDEYDAGGSNEFTFLHFSDDHLYVGFLAAGVDYRVNIPADANNWPQNKWTHYCVRWVSGGVTRVYINGVAISDNGGGTVVPSFTNHLRVGNYYFSDHDYYGKLDDFRIYNRALSDGEVKALYNMGNSKLNTSQNVVSGSTLQDGLVGLWSFNGPDVTDKVYDRSGQGNNGYFVGATSSAKTIGRLGQALRFNGSSDYVRIDPASSINDLGPITVSMWIKPSTITGNHFLLNKDSVDGFGIEYKLSGATLQFAAWSASGSIPTRRTSSVLVANQWQHVVLTWDRSMTASNVHMYVNGIEPSYITTIDGSGTFITDAGNPVVIGANNGYFSGSIDEVRVYNRVLSASEIQQLYNLGR